MKSYGYWSLTDFILESQLPSHTFHGGLGMFTFNGIPKAHYHAFHMLTRLGDVLVSSGEGWFLTRHSGRGTLALILYNYCHYNQLISAGELFDMTDTDRYTAFSDMKPRKVSIRLEKLDVRRYLVRETFVNRDHGSAYDAWVAMGGIELERPEDLDALRRNSLPGSCLLRMETEEGCLNYSCRMEPLEVRLVEFEPDE